MIKSYIIANKYQEQDILLELYKKDFVWADNEPLLSYVPSRRGTSFPYGLNVRNNRVSITTPYLTHDIVFDGRTEPEPVKVSKEIMRDIEAFVENYKNRFDFLYDFSIYPMPVVTWIKEKPAERGKLLIDYINGNRSLITIEQYVVRSIEPDENGDYAYLRLGAQSTSVPNIRVDQIKLEEATHFETREEATEFLIAGMEIVEG